MEEQNKEETKLLCENYVNIAGGKVLIGTYCNKNEFPEMHHLNVYIDKYIDINDKRAKYCPECGKKSIILEEELCRINPHRHYYCMNCGAVYEQILHKTENKVIINK